MSLKVVDLFCGVGGLSLGFQRAGHDIIAAFDNWDKSVDIYNKNFKNHKCDKLDLSNVGRASAIISGLKPDGVIGGPPCQDFSSAGKREEGARADLTRAFAVIVKNIQPKFFVMENVATARNSSSYKMANSLLKQAGYECSEVVLDASYFGVLQKRKRFFL